MGSDQEGRGRKLNCAFEHLTRSIKFTFEEELDNSIPFLDAIITKKDDGSLKLRIYRKPTHTYQYLQFQSHHPLHHKLGVVRTLMDREDSIVSEQDDHQKEKSHIEQALNLCGYPQWSINKVVEDKEQPKPTKCSNNKRKDKGKSFVVLPYVEGLSERVSRVFKKHSFSTSLKPHRTIQNVLVHLKDKRDILQTAEAIYEIPSCPKTYIGETGRLYIATRLGEHKSESDKVGGKTYIRSQRKASKLKLTNQP